MFLQQVKVKQFTDSVKKYGTCPFTNTHKSPWRGLHHTENKNPNEVYHVIGVTTLKEGYSEYLGYEEGYGFVQSKSHKVYIVAKGVGRRFKALPEDIEAVEI